jgi:putative DNA primase/helicase
LAGRGIILSKWPSDIQEHPSLAVYEDGEPTGHRFPALIAVIRNGEGRPAGLHITFLKEDGSGKAPIESPRRIIGVREGSTRGGAVRLFDPRNGEIGLAEGLETALSAYLLTGTPTWAALNAGGIERAVLPEEIRRITIFADRDGAGLKSAALACERFRREGREVEILAPSEQGQDFNDILLKQNAHQTAI